VVIGEAACVGRGLPVAFTRPPAVNKTRIDVTRIETVFGRGFLERGLKY
jgi:hypothetical protein